MTEMDRKSIFWETIAEYNTGTIWIQAAIASVAILLVVLESVSPSRRKAALLKAFMGAVNFWIGIAYYMVFGSGRDYNLLMALLWIILGGMWLFDARKGTEIHPEGGKSRRILSCIIMLLPAAYPVTSILIGREWPMITTSVMPCSVAVFNVGVMLMFYSRVNIVMAMMLCHWSLAGLAKVYSYGLLEDYILGVGILPAAILLLKKYIAGLSGKPAKPSPKVLNVIFMLMIFIVFAAFTYSLIRYTAA